METKVQHLIRSTLSAKKRQSSKGGMSPRHRIPGMSVYSALFLALAVAPASAGLLYSNGPINGNVDGYFINFGYAVSDTFSLAKNATVNGFTFGAWEYPDDVAQTVDWSITSPDGTITYGSGTAAIHDVRLFNNKYGYDVDRLTVVGLDVKLAAATYWLTLQDAVTDQESPLFWDVNNGVGCPSPGCPSSAKENILGKIPSESFTIFSTPEPSTLVLFGSSVIWLGRILRRGSMMRAPAENSRFPESASNRAYKGSI